MVGMVVTISPSFNLYRIVVLPAASRPTRRGWRCTQWHTTYAHVTHPHPHPHPPSHSRHNYEQKYLTTYCRENTDQHRSTHKTQALDTHVTVGTTPLKVLGTGCTHMGVGRPFIYIRMYTCTCMHYWHTCKQMDSFGETHSGFWTAPSS